MFIDGENRCIVLIFGEFYIKLVKFVKNFVYFGVKKNDIVGFSGWNVFEWFIVNFGI